MGLGDMTELLREFGARVEAAVLTEEEQFAVACVGDPDRARAMLHRNPALLRSPKAMALAIEHDRVDAVRFLLDAGMSPDIRDPENGNQRPLHVAAFRDAPESARLLIERGAEVDAKENTHDATPIGFASYGQKARMIDLLGAVSANVWVLTLEGKTDRLREVLRAEPARAWVQEEGWTPLMWLPADESRALEIATLLLTHGADPRSRNGNGDTAADIARRRALDSVADLLDGSARA
jgi:ankyrin repeat protein